jgi:signal peptidase I
VTTVIDVPVRATPSHEPRRGVGARLWVWAYRVLLVSAVALAVYATAVPWSVQHSGARLVTITSGSMVPHFPVGSTITIHPVTDPTQLAPGQIITFHAMGNGVVISHRVVKRIVDPGVAGVFYQTKGDANRTADPDLAPAGNVIGVADDVLPEWQGFAVSMQTPRGRLAVYGSLFLIVAIGELADLVAATRRRRSFDDVSELPAPGAPA